MRIANTSCLQIPLMSGEQLVKRRYHEFKRSLNKDACEGVTGLHQVINKECVPFLLDSLEDTPHFMHHCMQVLVIV